MLVSVCIPVRDGAPTIAETLVSVLSQELPDAQLEVIVSDNGSTDGTEQVVRPFLADARVRYWRSERDLELFESFQRAVELSSGEVFMALGSDDVLLPGCLAHLLDRLRSDAGAAVVLVGCSARIIDGSGRPRSLRLRPRPLGRTPGRRLRQRLLWTGLNLVGSPSTVLIRRGAFDVAGGFRPDAGYAGDLDLWLRLAAIGDADLSGEELVQYRVHERSFTSRRSRGQVASVLAAVRAEDGSGRMQPIRGIVRGVVVRLAWIGRRVTVQWALRG